MNVEIDVPTIRGRCTPLRKTGSNTTGLAIGRESHDLLEKSARLSGFDDAFSTQTFLSCLRTHVHKIVVNSR